MSDKRYTKLSEETQAQLENVSYKAAQPADGALRQQVIEECAKVAEATEIGAGDCMDGNGGKVIADALRALAAQTVGNEKEKT